MLDGVVLLHHSGFVRESPGFQPLYSRLGREYCAKDESDSPHIYSLLCLGESPGFSEAGVDASL
jgi:hypothetical protein